MYRYTDFDKSYLRQRVEEFRPQPEQAIRFFRGRVGAHAAYWQDAALFSAGK